VIEPGTEPDAFLDLVEQPHLLSGGRLVHFDDQKAETVGSEVHRRQLASRGG
jgi:hypothetical protein